MQIACPHCGYSREVPADRVPDTARSAKCPNCGKRFPFSKTDAETPLRDATFIEPEEGSISDAAPSPAPSVGSDEGSAASWDEEVDSSLYEQEEPRAEITEAIPTKQDVLPWDDLEVAPSEEEELEDETEAPEFRSVPWENAAEGGLLGSLFKTVRQALFGPSAFFRRMNPEGTFGYPISFSLLLSFVGFFFQFLWGTLFNSDLITKAMSILELPPDTVSAGVVIGTAIMVPVLMLTFLVGLFVQSAILHICLLILRGANAPFLGTFKVMSYSSAVSVFLIIPFLGSLLAFIWGLVLTVIGISEVHSIGIGKSVLAILLPFILLVVLFMILFLTFQVFV